ncbi:MAG TPA: 1-phosphofructokinase family hexose kinase [Burkholderiaceae bacterium]|nr:1-phosphofructokinase family hexose kinase [Burkholderiaceae bacterium]
MKPIVTLTLNPSIDDSSEADHVRHTHKVRTRNERYDPGGGGINVARVVAELGERALAVYLAGGVTGSVLQDLIRQRAIDAERIGIAGNTRINHVVLDRGSRLEYRFVADGPTVTAEEAERCLQRLAHVEFDYLVASGSLPRGIDDTFYVRVGELVRRKGARLVLDTSGAALRETIGAGGVHLVKPSLGEFEQLVGAPLRDSEAQEQAAIELVRTRRADLIAVTMGHRGALLASAQGVFRVPALQVDVRSAVGAGDSFVAAMTVGLAQGRAPIDAFKLGVAAGTAAVLTPGTELCRRADIERLYSLL